MLTVEINGDRKVHHRLTCVTAVTLQQKWFGIACGRQAGAIVEHSFGAVVFCVIIAIPGKGLGVFGIVGGKVAIFGSRGTNRN